jgi:hypothetical protein
VVDVSVETAVSPDDHLCEWCEDSVDDAGGGFHFEPAEDAMIAAPAGWYCSVSCWLSAA